MTASRSQPPIAVASLEAMARTLYEDDVIQGGWECDPEGVLPGTVGENLAIVQYNLADAIESSSFRSTSAIKEELAPDAMRYALRVARWGGIALKNIVPRPWSEGEHETSLRLELSKIDRRTLPLASFVRANGVLARQLRDEAQHGKHQEARARHSESLRSVSALLVQASHEQSKRGNFDLEEAFNRRLELLRQGPSIGQLVAPRLF